MKRTALSRGATHDDRGRPRFSTFDPVDGERARKPGGMKRKLPKRLARRAHLDAHGDFVRLQPCASCGRAAVPRPGGHKGPWRTGIAAAHITLGRNEKGMGMKVRDEQRAPLCDSDPATGHEGCHPQWDQHKGKFAKWSDEARYSLGTTWVLTTLARWEAHEIETVLADGEARVA